MNARITPPRYLFVLVLVAAVGVGSACTADAIGSGGGEDAVTIYRDAFGVPHIVGETPEALMYGAGYALMRDRMAQFEESRRAALGRRAELAPDYLEADRRQRLVALSEAETREMFEALSPEHQRMMRAHVAGLNKAIDEALEDPENRMPYEFGVLWEVEPEPWTLHDLISTFAWHRQTLIGSSSMLQNLEFLHYLVDTYGEDQARIIFDDVLPLDDPDAVVINPSSGPFPESLSGSISETATTPGPVEAAPRPFGQLDVLASGPAAGARTLGGQLALVAPLPEPEPALSESRSLVIAPERSATDNVLMMQATSDGPQVRYIGGGFDAYGYTRQGGGPGLVMGRGPTHGWLQNVGPDDQIDIFAEQLNPENHYQYWFSGEWRDMERRTETIHVRGGPDETVEIVTTVHGPVVAWDLESGVAYAEQNALRGNELNDWVCNLEFARAHSLAEFESWVGHCWATATINYGDEDGTIAHWHAGHRPIRADGLDPRLPTPGTGEYEWQGSVPFSEWSKFKDPAEGFFHAWNRRATPADPYRDRNRWGLVTSRTYLAYDLMAEYDEVTLEDFDEINRQLGNHFTGDLPGPKFFVPYLESAVAGDSRLEQAVELMGDWHAIWEDLDGDGYYDAPGLPLMDRWLAVARETILGGVLGEWESRTGVYETSVLHRAIQGDDAGLSVQFDWFQGRDRDEVLRETVARVVDELTVEYGTEDMTAWKKPIYWRYYADGEFGQHADKPSRRSSARGSTAAELGIIPFAIPDNGSEQWNGIMEIGPGVNRVWDASPTGGQNLFINLAGEATPHIGDQLMRHADFDLKPVPMSLEDLRAEASSELTLEVPPLH